MENKRPNYKMRKVGNESIYQHREVAEILLGRPLKAKEVVHHIDNQRDNNSPDNLMVFTSLSDHARFHSLKRRELIAEKDLVRNADGTYSCGENFKVVYRCKDCATPIDVKATRCLSCHYKAREKIEWPPLEELMLMVKSSNYSAVGRDLGVSGNAIKKRIKRLTRDD